MRRVKSSRSLWTFSHMRGQQSTEDTNIQSNKDACISSGTVTKHKNHVPALVLVKCQCMPLCFVLHHISKADIFFLLILKSDVCDKLEDEVFPSCVLLLLD